jgi:hypothetical protein
MPKTLRPSSAPTALPSDIPTALPSAAASPKPTSAPSLGLSSVLTPSPLAPSSTLAPSLVPSDAPKSIVSVSPAPSASAVVVANFDLPILQQVRTVAMRPGRRASKVAQISFTPIPGALATEFYYSKNKDVYLKEREVPAIVPDRTINQSTDSNSWYASGRRSSHVDLQQAGPQSDVLLTWRLGMELQTVSYQSLTIELLRVSWSLPLEINAEFTVIFRKMPGRPDIFCISDFDESNETHVALGFSRGRKCSRFTAAKVSNGSISSFWLSPFTFRLRDNNKLSDVSQNNVKQFCEADNTPHLIQLFAVACNSTEDGEDILCDLNKPSRALLLQVSCSGQMEQLQLASDSVVLSKVGCIVEVRFCMQSHRDSYRGCTFDEPRTQGRLEPSDLFCRDPTSANELLGAHLDCAYFDRCKKSARMRSMGLVAEARAEMYTQNKGLYHSYPHHGYSYHRG